MSALPKAESSDSEFVGTNEVIDDKNSNSGAEALSANPTLAENDCEDLQILKVGNKVKYTECLIGMHDITG